MGNNIIVKHIADATIILAGFKSNFENKNMIPAGLKSDLEKKKQSLRRTLVPPSLSNFQPPKLAPTRISNDTQWLIHSTKALSVPYGGTQHNDSTNLSILLPARSVAYGIDIPRRISPASLQRPLVYQSSKGSRW